MLKIEQFGRATTVLPPRPPDSGESTSARSLLPLAIVESTTNDQYLSVPESNKHIPVNPWFLPP
jgi:hypothetical protein